MQKKKNRREKIVRYEREMYVKMFIMYKDKTKQKERNQTKRKNVKDNMNI